MRFHYIAFHPDSKITEGEVDSKDSAEVLNYLARQGLRPIAIEPIQLEVKKEAKRFFGTRITITDKVFLTKYMALMLKVGTDLFRAIDILIADFDKPVLKAFLLEVRGALERGEPFHSTFAKYPKFFSDVFVNLIKAGESSGSLDRVFEDLSNSLEKESELKSRIKAALIYPMLLLGMAVLILTFLVTFALPRIAAVFSESGVKPPVFSRVVFSVGLFLEQYIFYFLFGGAVAAAFMFYFFFRNPTGKKMLSRLLNLLPVVRGILTRISMQRFAGTLASLLKSGLPIIGSLEITANAVGNEEIKESLRRIANDGVARGLTIGEAFRNETAFPKVVVNLIAISEKAGHLDEILETLSSFYDVEIDRSLKTLVSLLEPALLSLIGLVVAMIALSIILPIYQLVGQF